MWWPLWHLLVIQVVMPKLLGGSPVDHIDILPSPALEDSIKLLQKCLWSLSPELRRCSIYPSTLVHPWLSDAHRSISSSALLSVPHIEAAWPEKATGIQAGPHVHVRVLRLPPRNIHSAMLKRRCTHRWFRNMVTELPRENPQHYNKLDTVCTKQGLSDGNGRGEEKED